MQIISWNQMFWTVKCRIPVFYNERQIKMPSNFQVAYLFIVDFRMLINNHNSVMKQTAVGFSVWKFNFPTRVNFRILHLD